MGRLFPTDMELSDERLDEFADLFLVEFGGKLSRQEAMERGQALLQLVSLAHRGHENENTYGSN